MSDTAKQVSLLVGTYSLKAFEFVKEKDAEGGYSAKFVEQIKGGNAFSFSFSLPELPIRSARQHAITHLHTHRCACAHACVCAMLSRVSTFIRVCEHVCMLCVRVLVDMGVRAAEHGLRCDIFQGVEQVNRAAKARFPVSCSICCTSEGRSLALLHILIAMRSAENPRNSIIRGLWFTCLGVSCTCTALATNLAHCHVFDVVAGI